MWLVVYYSMTYAKMWCTKPISIGLSDISGSSGSFQGINQIVLRIKHT